ncbi:MAG: peptidoglycan-binding protein [Actinomycetota bacterium]
MTIDRRMLLALVAGVAVLSAGISWFAGQRIKSPAEVAAEAAPPEPSLITVPIELRTLSQDVVIRGTITPSDETSLSATSTTGSGVVTGLPKEPGAGITEGDVLVEIAGRPVIALEGALPAFRNLIPGLEGPEVSQLEEALVRLGYDPGTVDDTYTTDTAAAVESLYRDRGYAAPESDPGDVGALDGAQAGVDGSQDALTAARNTLDEANTPVTANERTRLDLAVSRAELDLTAAQTAAGAANAEAESAVAEARAARTAAQTAGPDGGADEAALAEAAAALSAAEATQTQVAAEQELLVDEAELAVAEAKEARTDRLNPPDLSDLRAEVTAAEEALADARTELGEAQERVGAWIPESEVVFFSSLPRQVAQVFAEVGEEPSGPVMTITGAETLVESGISAADRQLIAVGDEAMLEDDQLGLTIPAVITFVADSPGGPNLSSDRYAVRLEPSEDVPDEALGLNLRVSVPITSSGGDVLAVPLAALSAGADGTARVEVEGSAGVTEFVEVSTGLRAEGMVEIEGLGLSLGEGDRVVVGRDLVLPTGDDDESIEAGDGDDDADDGDS